MIKNFILYYDKIISKKSNQKQGIAALMLVLILGTIALAIAISEFTYSI